MSSFATGLLSQLLDLPNPNVQVQQWALSVGTASGNTSLLSKLAAHPALDAEVDAALAEVTLAPVRAAWLSRPQRDKSEVESVLLTETRTTVLKSVANQPGLAPEVYGHLSESLGVSALPTLLANPDVPARARLRAAQRLAHAHATHVAPSPEVEVSLRQFPEIAREMFASTQSAPLAVTCVGYLEEVRPEDIDRVLSLVESLFATTSPKWAHNALQTMEGLVSALSAHRVSAEQRSRLRECADSPVGTLYSPWRVAHILPAIDALVDLDGFSTHPAPSRIRSASSDEEAFRAFNDGVNQGLSVFMLLLPALESTHVSALTFAKMLNTLANRGEWHQLRMLWRSAADPKKLAVLYTHFPWLDLDQGLSRLPDPAVGIAEVASYLTQSQFSIPKELFSSQYFAPSLLLQMPARALARTATELDQSTLESLESALLEAVTTDTALAVLCALGDEYEGSLSDLLTVSVQV